MPPLPSARARVIALILAGACLLGAYPSPQATAPGRRTDVYGYSRSERPPSGLTIETTDKVLAITSISKPLMPYGGPS